MPQRSPPTFLWLDLSRPLNKLNPQLARSVLGLCAPGEWFSASTGPGAVNVYRRDSVSGDLQYTEQLTPSDGVANDLFGLDCDVEAEGPNRIRLWRYLGLPGLTLRLDS